MNTQQILPYLCAWKTCLCLGSVPPANREDGTRNPKRPAVAVASKEDPWCPYCSGCVLYTLVWPSPLHWHTQDPQHQPGPHLTSRADKVLFRTCNRGIGLMPLFRGDGSSRRLGIGDWGFLGYVIMTLINKQEEATVHLILLLSDLSTKGVGLFKRHGGSFDITSQRKDIDRCT